MRRDWKCPTCGTISPDVPTSVPDQWCPMCGNMMDKVWSAPMVLFKGGGWTSPASTLHPDIRDVKEKSDG